MHTKHWLLLTLLLKVPGGQLSQSCVDGFQMKMCWPRDMQESTEVWLARSEKEFGGQDVQVWSTSRAL